VVVDAASHPYGDWERTEVVPFVPSAARSVLDVGCSFGAFGMSLKRDRPGIEVWGVEPNRGAASVAENRLDVVVNGSFPQDVPDRQFDCVVFNDVLEHLDDPWSALRRARRYLTPGGRLVASIPNVRHFSVLVPLLTQGRWTYRDTGILDRTHLRFFTRSTMIELFESTGWCVESIAAALLTRADIGELPRLLAMLGKRAEQFRAQSYIVVARHPRLGR